MKWKDNRQTTGSARSARFVVNQEYRVELLKRKILQDRLENVADPELKRGLLTAGNESVALASLTPYPLLLLPELMNETFRTMEARVKRQQFIRERTRTLAA